jgi:hypothetical protein
MDITTEYVFLNAETLEEDPNGIPYTRQTIGQAVILIAGGHPTADAVNIKADEE